MPRGMSPRRSWGVLTRARARASAGRSPSAMSRPNMRWAGMAEGLAGKAAFVTGAGGGIGRATALALGRAGARVMIVDVDGAGLDTTRAKLEREGVEVASAVADVSDQRAVDEAVAATVGRFGALDLAHNNAGVM